MKYDQVVAEPGKHFIIDAMLDGKTVCERETIEEVRKRYPSAELYDFNTWIKSMVERENPPIVWEETTEEKFEYALECLPPVFIGNGGFLQGEPSDHHSLNGFPRYQGYKKKGNKYLASSRPVTVKEMKEAMI